MAVSVPQRHPRNVADDQVALGYVFVWYVEGDVMSPLVFTLVVGGVVIASLFVSFKRYLRADALAQKARHATPRTLIRDVVDGARVRVVGTVVSHEEYVKAPYTATLCLAYHAYSTAHVPDGMHQYGKAIRSEPSERVLAFRIQDETGALEVDVDHVTLDLEMGSVVPAEGAHVFGANIVARNSSHTDYYEAKLVAGASVAVTGVLRRGADGTLRLVGTQTEPLVISNQPGALDA